MPEHHRFAAALVLSALGTALLRFAPSLLVLSALVLVVGIFIAPTLIGGYTILERQALPGRETEAMSWVGFSNCLGGGAGTLVTGLTIDHAGSAGGYLVATGYAMAAAVLCLAALPWIRPATVLVDYPAEETALSGAPAAVARSG
jgi:predicted MFS family arabinose efflux permease